MIYYAKRHRGKVFVNGNEVLATHADDVLNYAVCPVKDSSGYFLLDEQNRFILKEVIRGRVSFVGTGSRQQK